MDLEIQLSVEEKERLQAQGKALALGKEFPIHKKSVEDLRVFVQEYCAGHILTNLSVPPSMIGTIFAPIMLGGMKLPAELEAELNLICPDPGPEPVAVKFPDPPAILPNPPKPSEPSYPVPDPAVLEELDMGGRWSMDPTDHLSRKNEYLNSVELEKTNLQSRYLWELSVWELEIHEVTEKNAKNLKEHQAEILRIQEGNLEYQAACQEWETKKAQRDELDYGVRMQYFSTVGAFYGKRSDAMGNMCINGYPMLHTVAFMHKDDWDRVVVAINRELDRANSLEV